MADVIIDASAMVDLLLDNDLGRAVGARIGGEALHAPAHLDAEVLSALGRLQRAGDLDPDDVADHLADLVAAPIERHPVHELLLGALDRRHRRRLVDAVYVELAVAQGMSPITTDHRLRDAPSVEVVEE